MEQYIVEGKIAVKAIIQGNKRKVYQIYIDRKKNSKRDKDINFILGLAKKHKIPVLLCNREQINELASGTTHGGVIASCGDRMYQDIHDYVNKKDLFLALIEGVEDPYNFGDICRTLYAAGCDGILLPKRNWTSAVNTLTKASAGASEFIAMFEIEDFESCLKELKTHDIKILSAMRENAVNLYEYEFPKKFVIGIGGALRGLSSSVLSQSEQNIYIPYHQNFKNALSSASSSAVFAFEILRQRSK